MERGIFEVARPTETTGSLCCGVRSKMVHSIVNNGTTCDAAFRGNSLATCS